jgi:DNA-binding XRE family transcriptional regulator
MKDTRTWKKSEIAVRFRTLREKAYFTQSRLGELIGLSRKCICQIESGSVMPHCRT